MVAMDMEEHLRRVCVRIWRRKPYVAENYRGTGFLIAPDVLVTARHVVDVDSKEDLFVTGRPWGGERTVRDGPFYPLPAGTRAKARDVAIICLAQTNPTRETPLTLATDRDLRSLSGATIHVAGFSRPFREEVRTIPTHVDTYDDTTDSIVIMSSVEAGMSGGPAVYNGHLVGILFATNEPGNRSYIVPLPAVGEFLEKYVPTSSVREQPLLGPSLTQSEAMKWVQYVDREDQVIDLARCLRPHLFYEGDESVSTPLFVAFLHCRSHDRHRLLRGRFEHGEADFNPDSDYADLLPGMELHDIEFPFGEEFDIGDALTKLKFRLRSRLSAKGPKPSEIREALNLKNTPQGVFSTISGASIGPNRQQLFKRWVRFWEEVCCGTEEDEEWINSTLILFFALVADDKADQVPTPARTHWLFGRLMRGAEARVGLPLKEWIKQYRQSGECRFARTFTPLGPVSQSDVEDWLKMVKTRRGELADLVDESIAQVEQLIPVEGVPMSEFVDRKLQRFRLLQ